MTPRRLRASTVNSRTPPVYRRLKPAVKTMRAAITSTLRAAPSAGRVPAVHAFIAPAGEDVGGRTKSGHGAYWIATSGR